MCRLALLAALSIFMACGAACANSEAGTPHATSSVEAPTSTAGGSLPPRPRSLPLDGVDPCKLLSEQQLASFSIDRPPLGGVGSGGPLKGAPDCDFGTSVGAVNDWGFLITVSTNMGLGEYLEKLKDNPTRRVISVDGFPAIQDEQKSSIGPGNDTCFVDVDVAEGQMLALQFGQIAADEGKVLPMETLCAKAVEVAEAALTTLQAQR
jgi:Protein of unknown function (DUF3558)